MGTKDSVLEAALKLPPHDRAVLAEELIDSLEDTETRDVDGAWLSEVERRMRDEGGDASFMKPAEVQAEVNRILKR